MSGWFTIDWSKLFTPQMSLPEIVIRGVLIYLALCLMLRVVLKRQAGQVSLSDLLVVTLVAGVCRNPLVRDAYSITDGLLVVAVVLSCSYSVDWLCYYVPFVHQLMHPPPRALIKDGQILKQCLRYELMTENQLRSKLRGHGVREPEEVAEAYMEGDGHVSVLTKKDYPGGSRPSLAQPSCNGSAAPARNDQAPAEETEDAQVGAFLHAAGQLQHQLAWHQRRITEIRAVLARHGVRASTLTHATPEERTNGTS